MTKIDNKFGIIKFFCEFYRFYVIFFKTAQSQLNFAPSHDGDTVTIKNSDSNIVVSIWLYYGHFSMTKYIYQYAVYSV